MRSMRGTPESAGEALPDRVAHALASRVTLWRTVVCSGRGKPSPSREGSDVPNSLILRGTTSRKAAFLGLIGILYLILGTAYGLPAVESAPFLNPYTAAINLTEWWWPNADPLQPWGIVFAAVGAVVIVSAVQGRKHPHGGHKGFLLAEGWAVGWGALAFCSSLWFDSSRGWVTGLIFLTFGFALHLVDGMGGSR